ncbi:major facilitator superfamily domain-containing protein [Umbelopsis sp. PMI_123]|nr:major facilitator superfamily domain-containing protein [Umbelopsis sp. PMI_123]
MATDYELLNEELSDTSKEAERALVRRLDRRLLAFAMVGNVIKVLDNTNLANAYISGLEEDIHATGLDYNWMGIAFTCGYLIMQTPSNMILSHTRPSIYLPCLEIGWCMLTLAMATVQSVNGVYIIRFLLGLFEAGFWPTIFLLGSWYTKEELGARNALFAMCGTLGTLTSGLLQALLLETMDGTLGISGWRWTFIIDGSFTAVLAIFGLKYLPDYPGNGTLWLSEEEHKLAIHRLAREGKVTSRKGSFFTKDTMKGLFCTWPLYIFTISWVALHISMGATAVLGIVARKSGYDAISSNLFTTPSTFLNMITVVVNGFLSDRLGTRQWCIVYPAILGVVGYCMLSAFVQPFGILWVGFLLIHAGLGSTNSIVMTWLNEIVIESNDIRAMTIAIMNTASQLSQMAMSLVLWPVTDAPQYHLGFTVCIFFVIVYIFAILCIGQLLKIQERYKVRSIRSPIEATEDIDMEEVSKMSLLGESEDSSIHYESPHDIPHPSSRARVHASEETED